MVYKVDGNPQLDSRDWSMYSNILKVIAFCSDAKIFPDSERVRINLDFDILASPVCQPFFEICQFKY